MYNTFCNREFVALTMLHDYAPGKGNIGDSVSIY